MKVWIAYCVCPQGHAILAAADEAESEAAAQSIIGELRAAITGLLAAGPLNPWCGICHAEATTWQYKSAPTRFRTLEEATSFLADLEVGQIVTAIVHGEFLGPRSRTKH